MISNRVENASDIIVNIKSISDMNIEQAFDILFLQLECDDMVWLDCEIYSSQNEVEIMQISYGIDCKCSRGRSKLKQVNDL